MLAVTEQGRDGRGAPGSGSSSGHPAGRGSVGGEPPSQRPRVAPIVAGAGRAVSNWARARSLGPSSAFGISIALMLCGAAWLTAGTRADNVRAVVALWAGYLVFAAGRNVIAWPGEGVRVVRGVAPVPENVRARTSWLAAVGWSLAECVVYAGLAAGAVADHWPGTWMLAIAVLSLTGVRELMTASLGTGDTDDSGHGMLWRAVEAFVRMPGGGRILLIGVVAPIWGSRTALFALLDWSIIAIGFGLASQPGGGGERGARERRPRRSSPPAPASLSVLLRPAFADGADDDTGEPAVADDPENVALEAGEEPALLERDAAQEPGTLPGHEQVSGGAGHGGPGQVTGRQGSQVTGRQGSQVAGRQGSQVARTEQTQRLLLLRDDGALARWLGGFVRGSLLPLPPAVLGLAAIAVLTILGLQSLPSILFLTPALVMLLAAPGSSNPHAGRFDWLAPAVLLGAQFLYVAAIGEAKGVPGTATFALCAAVLLRYADLACPGRPVILARPLRRTWAVDLSGTDRERGSALGWEGRMLLMGAGAAAGIGTFAFIALTAYLGVLTCAKVLQSSQRFGEGNGR